MTGTAVGPGVADDRAIGDPVAAGTADPVAVGAGGRTGLAGADGVGVGVAIVGIAGTPSAAAIAASTWRVPPGNTTPGVPAA